MANSLLVFVKQIILTGIGTIATLGSSLMFMVAGLSLGILPKLFDKKVSDIIFISDWVNNPRSFSIIYSAGLSIFTMLYFIIVVIYSIWHELYEIYTIIVGILGIFVCLYIIFFMNNIRSVKHYSIGLTMLVCLILAKLGYTSYIVLNNEYHVQINGEIYYTYYCLVIEFVLLLLSSLMPYLLLKPTNYVTFDDYEESINTDDGFGVTKTNKDTEYINSKLYIFTIWILNVLTITVNFKLIYNISQYYNTYNMDSPEYTHLVIKVGFAFYILLLGLILIKHVVLPLITKVTLTLYIITWFFFIIHIAFIIISIRVKCYEIDNILFPLLFCVFFAYIFVGILTYTKGFRYEYDTSDIFEIEKMPFDWKKAICCFMVLFALILGISYVERDREIRDENIGLNINGIFTSSPTNAPTLSPTDAPSNAPTLAPTLSPTPSPTNAPSNAPTVSPTPTPISSQNNVTKNKKEKCCIIQ